MFEKLDRSISSIELNEKMISLEYLRERIIPLTIWKTISNPNREPKFQAYLKFNGDGNFNKKWEK